MELKSPAFLVLIIFISGCAQDSDFVEKSGEPIATGCCSPVCMPSGQDECLEAGGLFFNSPCSAVKECQLSCCDPYCTETTEAYCEQAGGVSAGVGCSEVDECEEGCCSPFCVQTTKALCGEEHGYGGDWTEGSCDSVEECSNVCCGPSNSIMTKNSCEQMGGVEVSESLCAGKGSITIEMPHDLSCICNDGSNPNDICTDTMNLVQSFAASFSPDSDAPEDSFMTSWLFDEKNYYFKGSGTYVMTGVREIFQLSEYTANCYGPGVPKGTTALVLTENKRNFNYEVSNTAEVTAQITQRDDGTYSISFSMPSTIGTMREIWSRTVTNGCPTELENYDSETYDDEIEGIIIHIDLNNVTTLIGYKTFTQYPPEGAFACEGRNNSATGIIRWSFDLPE